MNVWGLIANLVGGGLGGLLSGPALKDRSLGWAGNLIAGLIGGTIGSYIAKAFGFLQLVGVADLPIGSVFTQGGVSLVIGAIVTSIIGFIKGKGKGKETKP